MGRNEAQAKGEFEKIRSDCLRRGVLYEDPDFPASDKSLFYSRAPPKPFQWKRPKDLVKDPMMFVDGASRMDIAQGALGDCWLLASLACLCERKHLLHRVVPKDEEFNSSKYAGIFRFYFWKAGEWIEVIVDDRLPTWYGELVYTHSKEKNEFWSALLEKAYAKVFGSYEALKGGTMSEGMEDFTGGLCEFYELAKAPKNLFNIMKKAYDRSSLMGCSIKAPDSGAIESQLDNGLVMGHAYSITDVRKIKVKTPRMTGEFPMLRIRNPWGEHEWNGAWSDKSREWQCISEQERKDMGLTFSDDGEFWMAFSDFMKHYTNLEICNLSPDAHEEKSAADMKKKWVTQTESGRWQAGASAGGCRNFPDTFHYNPQIQLTLEEIDDKDDDDDPDEAEGASCIVALLQKGSRKATLAGRPLLTIGFAIYTVEAGMKGEKLQAKFFMTNRSTARSDTFINSREITGRFKLPPGQYCIVPSTFKPNENGEFLVRVFTEKRATAGEVDEQTGMIDIPPKAREETPSGKPQLKLTSDEQQQHQKMRQLFSKMAGEDMEIDAYELQELLTSVPLLREHKHDGFSLECCRSMVAMMDADKSGKLGFVEFSTLWADICNFKRIFQKNDTDRSGTFSTYELRAALREAGFGLNTKTLSTIVARYRNRDNLISFNDYVLCACRLKSAFGRFKESGPDRRGNIAVDLDSWVQINVYN